MWQAGFDFSQPLVFFCLLTGSHVASWPVLLLTLAVPPWTCSHSPLLAHPQGFALFLPMVLLLSPLKASYAITDKICA